MHISVNACRLHLNFLFYMFAFYNLMLSFFQAFHVLYHSDNNVLLGAPTGSGKTISAELAMLHLFNTQPDMKVSSLNTYNELRLFLELIFNTLSGSLHCSIEGYSTGKNEWLETTSCYSAWEEDGKGQSVLLIFQYTNIYITYLK